MEIKISTANLMKTLWIASVALSAIGFLLLLYGLVATLLTVIACGIGMAVIPLCLASSVEKLVDAMSDSDES